MNPPPPACACSQNATPNARQPNAATRAPATSRTTRASLPLLWIVLGVLAGTSHPARAGIPDFSLSYFVPQTGSVTTPTEGTIATRFFRICPNNDGGASLPNHARIKIVLLDLNGFPVPDVPAADVCVQFNGGTPAQGFSGVGADSIVANSIWNQSPLCPTITCLSADAPTDQNGVTYITFAGSTPGSPGVATRDPQRKWGHYDTELPVYVMGYKLAGRLTSGAANGTYTLRIKNFDVLGGLDDRLNRGAKVSYVDFNAVVQNLNANYCYWYDFDNSGVVTATDLNALIQHLGHDCDTPNNP